MVDMVDMVGMVDVQLDEEAAELAGPGGAQVGDEAAENLTTAREGKAEAPEEAAMGEATQKEITAATVEGEERSDWREEEARACEERLRTLEAELALLEEEERLAQADSSHSSEHESPRQEGDGREMGACQGMAKVLRSIADEQLLLWRLKSKLGARYRLKELKELLVMACIRFQQVLQLEGKSVDLLLTWGATLTLLAKKYFIPPLFDDAAEKYGQAVQLAPNRVRPLRMWAVSLCMCAVSRAGIDGEYCASLFKLSEEKFQEADNLCSRTLSMQADEGPRSPPSSPAGGNEPVSAGEEESSGGEDSSGANGVASGLASAQATNGGGVGGGGVFGKSTGGTTVRKMVRGGTTMTVIKGSPRRGLAVDTSQDFEEEMLRLAVDWGVAIRRHALVAEEFGELRRAMRLLNDSSKKFCHVLRLRPNFPTALHQWAKTIDCMSMIRVVDPKVDLTQAVELFLTMFTTLANVHGPELSLKPMIALCFSRNKAVQLAKPVAVLRYLAVNGKGEIRREAAENLVFIEEYHKAVKAEYDDQHMLQQTVSSVVMIKDPELAFAHMPDAARKHFSRSKVTYEHVRDHKDLICTVLLFLTGPSAWPKPLLQVHQFPNLAAKTPLPTIEFIQQDPRRIFKNRTKIGEGAFAEVFTANSKATGYVALKIYTKSLTEAEKMIRKEVGLLQSCNHANVVKYHCSYLWNDMVWVVMEYCNGGSLRQLLNQVSLNEAQIAYVAREVLQGLHYLQTSRRLVHRDIKSSNLLLFLDGRVQIGDLGLCEEIKGGELMPLPIAGSRCWMAPEVIYNKPYGFKADTWSLGCVLLEMANGRAPYHELAALKCMVMLATKGSPGFWTPKKWGSAFKDFVGQCFHKNQRTRAGIADLLKHPFLDNACEAADLVECLRVAFIANTLMNTGLV